MKDKDTILLENVYEQIHSNKKVTPEGVLDLIKSLPDADNHIFQWQGKWEVTNEWLAGGFAGRSFVGDTPEEAAQQLIDYLNQHIGHDSVIGREVTASGWPDLEKVKDYLTPQPDEDDEEPEEY